MSGMNVGCSVNCCCSSSDPLEQNFDFNIDCSQDFANQVRWSLDYISACSERNVSPGKFVAPAAGEFMSGKSMVSS